MNAIQLDERTLFYANQTRSARYQRFERDIAVNDSIIEFIDEQFGDDDNKDPKNFQWVQQIRDNLYTLIKNAAPVVSAGVTIPGRYFSVATVTFPYPADYKNLLYIQVSIGGVAGYARPTTFNEIGPLIDDSFKHPTNQKFYFLENASGYTLYKGTTGTATVVLFYLKIPTSYTIGSDSQLINPAGVLTNLLVYYATEISVYNGVTFAVGASITGTGAALTSGQVILSTLTQTADLPPEVHDTIAKRAASKLLAVVADDQQSIMIQNEAQK